MNFVLSSRARRDLLDLGEWISRDDPDAAVRLLAELEVKTRELVTMPSPSRSRRSSSACKSADAR